MSTQRACWQATNPYSHRVERKRRLMSNEHSSRESSQESRRIVLIGRTEFEVVWSGRGFLEPRSEHRE